MLYLFSYQFFSHFIVLLTNNWFNKKRKKKEKKLQIILTLKIICVVYTNLKYHISTVI